MGFRVWGLGFRVWGLGCGLVLNILKLKLEGQSPPQRDVALLTAPEILKPGTLLTCSFMGCSD